MAKLKDSGARRAFGTGAVRDAAEGKGRCDLLPLDLLDELWLGYTEWKNAEPVNAACRLSTLQYIDKFMNTGDEGELFNAIYKFTDVYYLADLCFMLLELSKHFEDGARKYAENNWKNGIPTKYYMDSAIRHYLKVRSDWDDEPHNRAVVWNLMCALWTVRNKPALNCYPENTEVLS